MNLRRLPFLARSVALLLAGTVSSSAVVIVLSDTQAPGPAGVLETFFNANFENVTQIRHANFSAFSSVATQDALNGTGPYAGMGAADVVIFGRTLSSGDYDFGVSDGFNALSIPVVSLTSYVARETDDRLGWHASTATIDKSVLGSETTVTSSGALILGFPEGTHDFVNPPSGTDSLFNGLGGGTSAFGGGSILATIGGDTLAAYWPTGAAPGNPTAADVATFPAPRLLFNLDNDVNGDLGNITPAGRQALIAAIDHATPLTAVPEPSSALLVLAGVGLAGARRRRALE